MLPRDPKAIPNLAAKKKIAGPRSETDDFSKLAELEADAEANESHLPLLHVYELLIRVESNVGFFDN